VKRFPDLELVIIGGGPLRESLERSANSLNLEKHVVFLGPKDYQESVRILCDCDIGLATFQSTVHSNITTTDPMKTKIYLSCGLPVITTAVTPISSEIAEVKAGVVIPLNREAFVDAVVQILFDLESFRINARRLSESHAGWSSDRIFDQAMLDSARVLDL
jgi:glycosyltransferase involved in cell wall biosynthesis